MSGSERRSQILSVVSNKAISDCLDRLGIYHSSQGYKYLMLGIRAILDGEVDRYCVKEVYDYVSKRVGVQAGQVDHAIRYAIRKTEDPVPNKEFLIRVADDLMLTADANVFLFESAERPGG